MRKLEINEDDLGHYEWLIQARARSQDALLLLLRLGKERKHFLWSVPTHQLFGLLVGAAFSLWRAAFLAQIDRTPESIHENALRVLDSVLKSNAVLFGQEKDMEEWIGGYYLNNGRFRLEKAALLPVIADMLKVSDPPDPVKRVFGLGIGIPAGNLRDSWDDCQSTLLWMLAQLERIVVDQNNASVELGSSGGRE